MKPMLDRRHCLIAGLLVAGTALPVSRVFAQAVEKASAFVQQTGDKLVAIVNGALAVADKRRALAQILEAAVDVDGIARFSLGRFWRTASADQQ